MKAWLSLSRDEFLKTSPKEVVDRLSAAHTLRFSSLQYPQIASWENEAAVLRLALSDAITEGCRILFEYDLIRLDKRLDVVICLPSAPMAQI